MKESRSMSFLPLSSESKCICQTNQDLSNVIVSSRQFGACLMKAAALLASEKILTVRNVAVSDTIRSKRRKQICALHHKDLYCYQLTAQEIRDAVRTAFDPEYILEQCQNDIMSLKEGDNVTTIYDSSRATSIACFLSPALLYQATLEAIAIETFLDEQVRASAPRGSPWRSDPPRLWQSLQSID